MDSAGSGRTTLLGRTQEKLRRTYRDDLAGTYTPDGVELMVRGSLIYSTAAITGLVLLVVTIISAVALNYDPIMLSVGYALLIVVGYNVGAVYARRAQRLSREAFRATWGCENTGMPTYPKNREDVERWVARHADQPHTP